MRRFLLLTLTVTMACGFAASSFAAEKLQLSDGNLPLQELRPLDRRVYILSLDGKWIEPAIKGKTYYINILFPNGQSYNHHPLNDSYFRHGEVRAVLQDYQLKRNGLGAGGRLDVVVSVDKPVTTANAPEVVSNVLQVTWPMDRPIVQKAPLTRYSPPRAIDPFPPEEKPLLPPKPVKDS